MKYLLDEKEYILADNETVELGLDGIYRVLVNTGTETYHGAVLTAVEEEEPKAKPKTKK